jgi:TRAP-type C4-dicarboxylate transport system substrate-binding protein
VRAGDATRYCRAIASALRSLEAAARDRAAHKDGSGGHAVKANLQRISLALAAAAIAGVVGADAVAQTAVKFGTPTMRESNHRWLDMLKERLEKRAADRWKVEVYPGGQLGSIPRTIEGVQLGTIEAVFNLPEFLVGVDKRFGVISMPGLIDDLAHGYRIVQDAEFRRAFWTIGEPKGIRMLGMYCAADAAYATRQEAKSVADLQGRKIRTFPSPMERETLARFGATVAPMSLEEVVPALQQGVIDGAKAAMTVHVAFKFFTVAKYAIRTGETFTCPFFMASKIWFDKLPADQQKMLVEETQATSDAIQEAAIKWNEESYEAWVKNGGALKTQTAAERAEMLKKLAGVAEVVVKGDPGQEAILATIKRVAERHRKK